MSHIFFNCPKCNNPLKLPPGFAEPGDDIDCPCCDERVKIPQNVGRDERETPTVIRSRVRKKAEEKPAGKNIFFDCTECQQPLKLPPGFAEPGDYIVCPCCNKQTQIPTDVKRPASRTPTIATSSIERSQNTGKSLRFRNLDLIRRALTKGTLITAGTVLIVITATTLFYRMQVVRKCTGKIDRGVSFFASYAEISYGDIEISPLGHDIIIKDIVIKPRKAPRAISISHLFLHHFTSREGMPRRFDIKAYGVHIPLYPETLGDAGPAMRALDYYCIPARATCHGIYDRDKNELTIKELLIKSPSVGDVVLSLTLSNIDLAQEDLTLDALTSGYREWEIRKGQFEYYDDSFISRFLAYQADYIGETVDELNAGMLTDLDAIIQKEADTFTKTSLSGFGRFIRNTQYLGITAAPDESVPIFKLQNTYDENGVMGLLSELRLLFSVDGQRLE